jgi:hypothetical protein
MWLRGLRLQMKQCLPSLVEAGRWRREGRATLEVTTGKRQVAGDA